MAWRWTNGPLDAPDVDQARCIAAPGSRVLENCGHSFVLTTHECAPGTVLDDARTPLACWRLHLDCTELGCAWSSGATSLCWSSVPFVSPSASSATARAAGSRLLEAAAADLAEAALC